MALAPSHPFSETVEENLPRSLTREEREKLYGPLRPFSVKEWLAMAPPPTAEELEEMEGLMRLRQEEREASLTQEAGLCS